MTTELKDLHILAIRVMDFNGLILGRNLGAVLAMAMTLNLIVFVLIGFLNNVGHCILPVNTIKNKISQVMIIKQRRQCTDHQTQKQQQRSHRRCR